MRPAALLYVIVRMPAVSRASEEDEMFLGIAGVLFLIWILGEVFTHGASMLIHVLAILWIISLVGHFFAGRRT